MAFVVPLLWGAAKLAVKYVAVPIAMTMVTAMVADALSSRMRARTASLRREAQQSQLDIDPALSPAP